MTQDEIDYWFRQGLTTGYEAGFSDGKLAAMNAVRNTKCNVGEYVEKMQPKQLDIYLFSEKK